MEYKICRTCLDKTTNTVSIFNKHNDSDQYSAMVMRCSNVDVREGDGLPDSICESCMTELVAAHDFFRKCETSDRSLRGADGNVLDDNYEELTVEVEVKLETLDDTGQDDQDGFDLSYGESTEILPCDSYHEKNTKTIRNKQSKIDKRKLRPKSEPIRCDICGLSVSCQSALRNHMRIHTGEKPFRCDTCFTWFGNKGALKRHILVQHTVRERSFICETCGSSFFTKNDIRTHLRVHTDERPYSCPYCSKTFRQIASVIRHKRMHTGEKPFTCTICSKGFIDKSHLNRHMYVHSNEKKFTCQLCNRSVKTKTALSTHMRTHSNENHNICNHCGMTFSLKGNLLVHIKRIHSEKSGECHICSKTYPDLAVHLRKHTGEKPYKCKHCAQHFATKRSLSNHMGFRHENVSKFKCSIGECSKTFPTAMMMEFHLLKQHTNHTPYVCQHCSRGFYRTSDLSRHLRASHNGT